MAGYTSTPLSFNGTAINAGNYRSYWDGNDASPLTQTRPVGPVEADIAGLGSRDVRGQPRPATWLLTVELLNLDQTILEAFYKVFDEEQGLVYLRITDGSSTTWRVPVRVIGITRVAAPVFKVTLRVPNPTLEEDSSTTTQQLNVAGSSTALAPTNAGSRKALPVFTVSPDSYKTTELSDYRRVIRGFLVNRSPFALQNCPLQLFEQSGADATVNHTAEVQGTPSTTLSGAHTASQTTINLVSSAGWNAAGGMGYITNGGANDEQFSYTNISGNQLQGVVRGIGGTVGFAHSGGQTTQQSFSMKNGDDVRVWLDDVEVERWLDGTFTTTLKCWVNVSLPPRVKLTLATAMTASVPANGDSVEFQEGVAQLPEKGLFAIENEVFYYDGKSGKSVTGIVRAVHGTTAAIHATSAPAFGGPKLYVVSTAKGQASAGPAPTARRPAIQLDDSTNKVWRWADQADDASSIFYERTTPDRPAQFTPGFDLDGNDIAPLIQMNASGNILTFKDDQPGDGSPPYNYVEQFFPQGIKAAASAIVADWTPSVEVLNLEMFGRDQGGTLKLLDQLQQSAAAAARGTTPAGILHALKLKARYKPFTGHRGDSAAEVIGNGQGAAQRFVVDAPINVDSVAVKLACVGAGTEQFHIQIRQDASGVPSNNAWDVLWNLDTSVASTTPTVYIYTLETAVLLPAGTYWLVVEQISAHVVNINWYKRAEAARYPYYIATFSAGVWTRGSTQRLYFFINTRYDNSDGARIANDQPVRALTTSSRTGITVSFDKLIVTFHDGTDPYTPYAHRIDSAFVTGTLYHCSGLLENSTTGDSIAIDKWMRTSSVLEIDCENRTVKYTESGIVFAVPKCIAPTNLREWMTLAPGANSLTYSEAGMVSTDVALVHRGQKV